MADRPIIFSGPMVRALLEGRKTQTRRVLKPQPECIAKAERVAMASWALTPESNRCTVDFKAPAYAPGDRLWVREAFSQDGQSDGECLYRATVDDDTGYSAEEIAEISWRPSIHMPRWASRMTLVVTDVRVQRLQKISAEDAQAEGACELAFVPPNEDDADEARAVFSSLWNGLHGPEAWDANPWVAAISFDVIHANIDEEGLTNA